MTKELEKWRGYEVLANHENDNIIDVMRENLGGAQVSEFDLDRVQIPAGGGQSWEVPTLDGTQNSPQLVGIICFLRHVRAYWSGKYEGGNEPPQCSSRDSLIGLGEPGGECRQCAMAQWQSDPDGRGQACKAMLQMFLLTRESRLPMVVTLPPTSLKPARQYLLRLTSHSIPYYGIETQIGLEKTKNADGLTYSRAMFVAGDKLNSEMAARVKSYALALEPAFRQEDVISTNGATETNQG